MSSILLNKDLQSISHGKVKSSTSTGFGNSFSNLEIPVNTPAISNDFAIIKILDSISNDVILTQNIKTGGFDLDGGGKVIFNIGNHLRLLGFDQGTYNVQYEFLRRIAGITGISSIDKDGEFYKGTVLLDDSGNRYKKVKNSQYDSLGQHNKNLYEKESGKTSNEIVQPEFILDETTKLGSVDAGLEINNINTLRDEIIISPNVDITNEKYLEETEILFNPISTYYLRTQAPSSQKIDDIELITEQKFGSSGIGVKSGQIAHSDNSIEFSTANVVITREQFDRFYNEETTNVILRDMFVTTVEQVPKTEVVTKYEVEARPLDPPIGAQTGTVSDLAQWVYDASTDSWLPNLGVIQQNEDGEYIVDSLVVGLSLKAAIQRGFITPFYDNYELLVSNARNNNNTMEEEYYQAAQTWWITNREVLRRFKNINGQDIDWNDYDILANNAYQVRETQINYYISDWGDLDGTINDLAAYFYMTDDYNLRDLQARQEDVTTFEEVRRYADYVGKISSVSYDGDFVNRVVLTETPKEYASRNGLFLYEEPTDDTLYTNRPMFFRTSKSTVRNLRTYLYFKDGYRSLIVNNKNGGNSGIFKLYNPLPEKYDIGSTCQIVEEVIPNQSFGVELIPWIETPLPTTILLPPGPDDVSETVQSVTTEYKNWAELSFQSSSLYRDIINKVISGSINETELNVDYSMYDNFVHFSSAEKRLSNFKYKLEKLEGYEQESSSIAGLYTGSGDLGNNPNTVVTGSQAKLDSLELQIDELKNNFDGYEKYLYYESSSFTTSSFGMHYDATWPKQNTSKPYVLYNSTQSVADTWYENQKVSASNYDYYNRDYLIYHLPDHISRDSENEVFLRLVKMLGQHFDNIKNYIDELPSVYDREESLTEGLPKQLASTVAKSLGWQLYDGYDLVQLDEYTTGKLVAQDNTITSSSAVPLEDVSKEVWKRILTNMPLFLKSKGTLKALKGLITCYGIPSTILRVREYGGPTKNEVNPNYEAVRRFSKALDFKTAQYVHTKWSGSADTGMKPKTVEFRFKAVSSSNMNLVQMQRGGESADIKHGQAFGGSNYAFTAGWTGGEKDRPSGWGVWLKDNGSADNMASIVFSISGSNQSGSMPAGEYKEVTSSLLPFFNGDFWSVMLRKELVNDEIFSTRIHSGSVGMVTGSHNFETGSLQTPFESVGAGGTLEVVSQSSYVFDGSYSLGFKNTKSNGEAYTYPYQNNDDGTNVSTYGDARVASASFAEEFDFSVYARSKTGGASMQMWIMELGEKGNILEESYTYYPSQKKNWGYGALHPAMYGIGTKWEKYTVRAKISHPQTKFIGVRLDNETNGQTIYFDKGELRKVGTDSLKFDIIAKQFDAGRDVIQYQTRESLIIDGLSNAASASYTGSWEQDGNLFIGGTTRAQNWYGGFVSGSTLSATSSSLSGSMMEFRLWSTPLDEQHFDTHVETPQSFVGNNYTGSLNELVQRLSFNEDTNHGTTGADSVKSIRNTAANSNYPYSGSAKGFADENNYSNVVDRLKMPLPTIGGIRRSANKARISPRQLKDEFKGSLNLSTKYRVEKNIGSIETKDSERLGIYFSPVDVINEDIIFTLSDLDLEDKLGDPRDNARETYDKYGGLKQTADKYWRKYNGSNNFWDYLRLINYFDHSVFSQIKKLIPARAKATVGVLIENNILERNKIPRETTFREYPVFEDTLTKLRNSGSDVFELHAESPVIENEIEYMGILSGDNLAELKYYEDYIERKQTHFGSVVSFGHNARGYGSDYSGSYVSQGGVSSIFTESIAMIDEQRTSKFNQEKVFTYSTKENYYQGNASGVSFNSSSYENQADDVLALERVQFNGCRNTKETALPSKDLNGKITYDAVTMILTNPYVATTFDSANVKLTTELDTGPDVLREKDK